MGKRGRGEVSLTPNSTLHKKRSTIPKIRHDHIIASGIDSKVLKEIILQQKEISNEAAAKENDPFSCIAEGSDNESDDDYDLSLFRETQNEFTQNEFTRECEGIDVDEERILDSFISKEIDHPQQMLAAVAEPGFQSRSGTCTLREAFIIGGVIRKVSIPSHHPGAALLKLAEMEYCGTTSYFIKVLLDKRYCLAYRVLDGLVAHFMRFLEDPRVMPVIWHQSLLSFVQWYRNELTREDKDKLDCLLQVKRHYLVTPEIERELKNSRNRGEKEDPEFTSVHSIIEDRFDIPDVPIEED